MQAKDISELYREYQGLVYCASTLDCNNNSAPNCLPRVMQNAGSQQLQYTQWAKDLEAEMQALFSSRVQRRMAEIEIIMARENIGLS